MSIKKTKKEDEEYNAIVDPESYEQYLRVISPKTWIVLSAVLAIIIGFALWTTFGRIEITSNVVVQKIDNASYLLAPEQNLNELKNYPYVEVGSDKYDLTTYMLNPIVISDTTNSFIKLHGHLQNGDIVYPVAIDGYIDAEYMPGKIVTDVISPASLLFNA